jgi:hypothetical protein
VLLTSDVVDAADLAEHTGWLIKPEGACKGDICVPLPADARHPDGTLDATVLSARLGMPLLHDDAHDISALGPATVAGHALESAVAPELELPDLSASGAGNPFRLSSLHGKKVLLVAWASW